MIPEIGDMWRWEDLNPLLILDVSEEREDGGIYYTCLDLVTGEKYDMFYHDQIAGNWRKLG